MPVVGTVEQLVCRYCESKIVIFSWRDMVAACCTNTQCNAYKQAQDLEIRGNYEEKRKRASRVFRRDCH
ncbi:MAG: hypothetical protein PHQ86_06600 [Dehalococcoidales bacterium]|nr:hypothetical protein [Dehalococcoidales bacterium]